MNTRKVIAAIVFSVVLAGCAGDEPSRTEVLCGRLVDSYERSDIDLGVTTVETMAASDDGTVEPMIWTLASEAQLAIERQEPIFYQSVLELLLEECQEMVS